MELLHEVPIRVMRAADIQYYMPPDVAMPRVQLELPYNRSMRTVLEVGRKSGSHNACLRIAGKGWRPYGGLDRSLECLFRRAAPFRVPYGPLLMTESCLLSPSISRLSSCSTQRFKIMDRFCFVDGDMTGALRLRLQNDRCHVQTFYRYFRGILAKGGGLLSKIISLCSPSLTLLIANFFSHMLQQQSNTAVCGRNDGRRRGHEAHRGRRFGLLLYQA